MDWIAGIDEPERLGAANAGPNAVDYVMGALAGCPNGLGHMVAIEMGFEIQSMQMRVEGNLDPR